MSQSTIPLSQVSSAQNQGKEHIVPCSPLDHLVYRGYANTLLIFPFPDPSQIPTATDCLRNAFEAVAQQHPVITGFVRLSDTNTLEVAYNENIPFGDRFRARDLIGDHDTFPHTYENLKAAGVPPNVWKPEIFGMYEKGASLDDGPQPVLGVQVTWIRGAMVFMLQQHHSWTDGVGLWTLLGRALRKTLDDVPAETIAGGLSKKVDRWVENAGVVANVGYDVWQKKGAVAAVAKTKALMSAAHKQRTPDEQDGQRLDLITSMNEHIPSLAQDFEPSDLKIVPNANETPFPSAPLRSPGVFARPYRSTAPTSTIFVLSTDTIDVLKSRIVHLIEDNPSDYLTKAQQSQHLEDSISSTTVIAALFWTHLTEARATRPGDEHSGPALQPDQKCTFACFVDVRERLGLPFDYPGNAVYLARTSMPVKKLLGVDSSSYFHGPPSAFTPCISAPILARACIAILDSIHALTTSTLTSTLAWIQTLDASRKEKLTPDDTLDFKNGPDLYFSSWSKFATSGVSIPGAASKVPEFSRKLTGKNDGAVIVLPKNKAENPWEVQVDARVDDMGRLRAELSRYTERVVDWEHWAVVGDGN